MNRLTWKNPDGTWGLKEYDIKKVPSELYGAICKLQDYEDTGLTPEQIQEVDELYVEKCRELDRQRKEILLLSGEILRLKDELAESNKNKILSERVEIICN